MANSRPFWIFALFSVVLQLVSCKNYLQYKLSNQKLCNALSFKKYNIPDRLDEEHSAIIVESGDKFTHWPRRPVDYCDFVIEVHDKRVNGMFAVIQNISLREKILGRRECEDYIKFERDDLQGSTFCGNFNRGVQLAMTSSRSEEDSVHREKSDYDSMGKIRTLIHIASAALPPSVTPNVTIVYTRYKDCNHTDPLRYMRVARDRNICILKEYFCDGIYNCGGMDGCLDEVDCPGQTDVVSISMGTKVTVAFLTTILHCFIIFIICLWICRKRKKLCWSPDCAGPSVENETPALSMNVDRLRNVNNSVPTAPMLEVVVPNSVQDKDLPPSYDSLFPE